MRLKLHESTDRGRHQDIVVGVDWTSANELLSVSDDRRLLRWSIDGGLLNEVMSGIDPYVTDIHCQTQPGQMVALAQSNGQFLIVSIATGKVEVTAPTQHQGSISCIRWNSDGSAIVTAGEDGKVLQWSRSGNLRARLVQCDTSIYCTAWSPDNQSILYATGPFLVIKPLRVDDKPRKWRAGAGLVLAIDWSPINNLIVVGGESCRYSVFDCHGRSLYVSKPMESSVTAVKWAPNGAMFAVAALDTLLLCDQSGWAYSRDSPATGSILSLAWTTDGTHLAGACVTGDVLFGQVVDRAVQWRHLEATLNDHNQVIVSNALVDVGGKAFEQLEFSDRVIELAIGWRHLVVATTRHIYSYHVDAFSTPNIFDIKGGAAIHLIHVAERFFVVVGAAAVGIRVYSYEGRELCAVKVPGLQTEYIKANSLAISPDAMAIVDRAKAGKSILFLDVSTGAPLSKPIACAEPAVTISLSQCGLPSDRKIAWVDANADLWISAIHNARPVKLGTLASSVQWNTDNDSLAAVIDTRLRVWHYPNVIFVDRDLVEQTTETIEEGFGRHSELVEFTGARCTVRRRDGALVAVSASPYPAMLFAMTTTGQWATATRLARLVNETIVWASLASMAIHGRDLDTAEECLAAIDAIDKLQNIQMIKTLPSKALRDAELALFRRRPGEAEQILLGSNLLFRAIKLNLRLYNWERALQLAQNASGRHLDLVVGTRQKYLERFNQQETIDAFLKVAPSVRVDWAAIDQEKQRQVEQERAARS
ncbi:WD domain, G-beta repeat [Plasmodiophora brassicae]